jgi:hypothetical protein
MTDRYLLQFASIRSLNDELRTRHHGGTVTVSDEVRELGPIVHAHALLTMAETDWFENDEHQAGRFLFCGRLFYWSIDYNGSPNPENAKLTRRTLYLWF